MTTEVTFIPVGEIDQAALIGGTIRIRTEQFPGRTLTSRIIGVAGDNLLIDRSGSGGLISQLIGKQDVEVHLTYKGQPTVFHSRVSKSPGGKIQIPLAERIIPNIRREFTRYNLARPVRLTYFDGNRVAGVRLNRLKWLETETKNISGGGMLVELPILPPDYHYLVMHLDFDQLELPGLLAGRIRHGRAERNRRYLAGVEFITKETYMKKLPPSLVRNLPEGIFEVDNKTRQALDEFLCKYYQDNKAKDLHHE